MAEFNHTTDLPFPPAQVFDFLVDVRNLSRVNPPTPQIRVIDAPARLHMGARFTVSFRKFGIALLSFNEVTWFEEGMGFTDVQVRGPFGSWLHTHKMVACPSGTRLTDHIEIAPPRGLMGWFLTEQRLLNDLTAAFAFRDGRFREVLR